jgi:uncharacterized protein YoxC
MNFAAEILVIILSITLTIFLVFAIVLIGYLIAITKQIRRVSDSVERTTSKLELAVAQAVKMSLPMMMSDLFSKIVSLFKKSQEKEKK